MPKPKNVYVKCDDLESIPSLMRDNYLYETELLSKLLSQDSTVLQVGSMDGERAIRLLNIRPDLKMSGLEIEESLVNLAKEKTAKAGVVVSSILGDITVPPDLPQFDYVICLNNTLGYIPQQQEALSGMRKMGNQILVSVYGEKFTDELARQYFESIGLTIKNIKGNTIEMNDFTTVLRYGRETVESWGSEVRETPAGYFCFLESDSNPIA
jgi:ubiquinone/menaquinone biosynthesis C-methylase UbiE